MKLFITILLISILGISQIAEAKRFGGGRSFGYSKSYSGNSTSKSGTSTAGKSSKSGFGKLLAAGAIGAALGYLFSGMGGGMGWIILAIIAGLIIFNLLKRKSMMQQNSSRNREQNNTGFKEQSNFFGGRTIEGETNQNFSSNNKFNTYDQNTAYANETINQSDSPSPKQSFSTNGMLPDGTPETVFKHQGLNLFQQLQELNTANSLDKIKGYVTIEIYKQLKDEVNSNNEIAQFENLDTEIVNFEKIDTRWVGSIKFNGKVKEDSLSSWENFQEIWHFDRDVDEHIWQLSGIQQIQ